MIDPIPHLQHQIEQQVRDTQEQALRSAGNPPELAESQTSLNARMIAFSATAKSLTELHPADACIVLKALHVLFGVDSK